MRPSRALLIIALLSVAACGGSGAAPSFAGTGSRPGNAPSDTPGASCRHETASAITRTGEGLHPRSVAGLHAPAGLTIDVIAEVGGARELAALPNGDLLVGTTGGSVVIVPDADGRGAAGTPQTYADTGDAPSAGVAFAAASCTVYIGTASAVWKASYQLGDRKARNLKRIATVREPGQSGDDNHLTTSVVYAAGKVYVGVGSTCNACKEPYPVRATVQEMDANGNGMHTRATRFRNAIALAANPNTGAVWAGGAGQDALPRYHPYEFIDNLSAHGGVADYGWPECEENHRAYVPGAQCAATVVPLVELPAYSTIIGAVIAPLHAKGKYALPSRYAGGLFVAAHGSWHGPAEGLRGYVPPRVVFVALNADRPAKAVNWSDPTTQWTDFVSGFQPSADSERRIGRPTGLAIGPQGDLFVADDSAGAIYRIRPK